MKLLTELLNINTKLIESNGFSLDYVKIIGESDVKIKSIHFDSSKVVKSSLFIANKGVKNDGHNYIMDAISAGASVIVCENLPLNIVPGITYVQVPENTSSYALGLLASSFFNNPSEKIKLVGVTGTNGKTSTVYYLTSLFKQLNFKVGMISTIENQIDNLRFPSTHTTPDAITINQLLSDMVDAGCEYCFMEVSSHGIAQNRLTGLDFDIGVFTNISRDHLDYHGTFENYLNTKQSFFTNHIARLDAKSIINFDNKYRQRMIEFILDAWPEYNNFDYYSMDESSLLDNYAHIVKDTIDGMTLEIGGDEITTNLVGEFNAYNLLVTYCVACHLGVDKSLIKRGLSSIQQVPGRFNVLKSKNSIVGIVDYAHTPDALSKVITSIRKFCDVEKDLIIVIGCGGNRDVGKRPLMGKVAADNCALSIFTSDNPRLEDPKSIIDDMCSDLSSEAIKKIKKIINREDAIRYAVDSASPGSIVLVAGKGHEKFQDSNGKKISFDDFSILQKLLNP